MKLTLRPQELPSLAFDRQVPVFNIYYPLQWDADAGDVFCNPIEAMREVAPEDIGSAALYFHFPFCDTICNFCPFTRGKFGDREIIARYLDALIREVERKAQVTDLKALPVRAIFVGGGTPSLMTAEEILKFGAMIKSRFDLSRLREFSFECEVKSVTKDKVLALKEIGVTNGRYGLQTFNPSWRDMFDLTASLDQIYTANELFRTLLPRSSFDILYAMDGHTDEEFLADIDEATRISDLVDVYPIDNVVTQIKLHQKLAAAGKEPTSANKRFEMNVRLREYMREKGFLPHNGHGYVRCTPEELARNPVVSRSYTFDYHNHVYGHADTVVVGFGVNAISILPRMTLSNTNNRVQYIRDMMEGDGGRSTQISRHGAEIDASRPLVTRLPYHGFVEKNQLRLRDMPSHCLEALSQFLDAGLVVDSGDEYTLTMEGWRWYVNMMYYSMPPSQKTVLDNFIIHNLRQPGRRITAEQITFQ
jgi:coproporphyrinogen III oxidase-like Fe-S oxidoreductase